MQKFASDANMSSNIWVLIIAAAAVILVILSQVTDTATCFRIPGCMMIRGYLGNGIANF